MLTIFTTTKPFRGRNALIQHNAIQSWRQLRPACEIILFGDDEGAADIAREFKLQHIPNVVRNEYGTPLLNTMFVTAQQISSYPFLCYINADIILMSDFIAAVRRIPFRRFLMVSQRWDVELNQSLDFSHLDWEIRLREYIRSRGSLHPPTGMDYFVFPRGFWGDIPPFAIGRTVWDNWLIYAARRRGDSVIDVTQTVIAVHQNHDWSHIPGGEQWAWEGPEAKKNLILAGGSKKAFTILDANWILTTQGLIPARKPEHCRRMKETLPILHPYLHFFKKQMTRFLRLPHYILSILNHLI